MVKFYSNCVTKSFFVANGIIKSQNIHDVMLAVDRGDYSKHNPYCDAPQTIGYSVTISAPHMVKPQKNTLN